MHRASAVRIFASRLGLTLLAATSAAAQGGAGTSGFDPADVEVSYLYAAIFGSGTYTIKNRRITMFRFPFAWNQKEVTATDHGLRWHFPVVIGYDDLSDVGSEWLEAILPDQLVTLTALPGVEFIEPITPQWQLKPFAQLGGGHDFTADESFAMTQLGVRSRTTLDLDDEWSFLLGSSLRWAAEYQFDSLDRTSFGVLDLGFEARRVAPFTLSGDVVDIGAYYIYQLFMPEWNINEAPDVKARNRDLHEFGLSIGFTDRERTFGLPLRRIRIGYKRGGNFHGVTIGADFPF